MYKYSHGTDFYRKDAQGNICALLDSNGSVVVRYVYDAWGNHAVLDANGADITDVNHIGVLNPFRYRGYFYDVETGLYYLQTRYYDPEIGRFITIDGISYLDPETINGLNLYAYCGNNPVMYTDPNGTTKWWEWLLGGLVVVGLLVAAAALTIFTGGTAIAALTPFAAFGVNLLTSVVTGMAVAATISYSSQLEQGVLNWQQFGSDIGVGAISGIVSYGIGVALNTIGGTVGQYLSQITIHSKKLSEIVPMEVFMTVGSKCFQFFGGLVFGGLFDNELHKKFGFQGQSMPAIIKGAIQSSVMDNFVSFFAYMWR